MRGPAALVRTRKPQFWSKRIVARFSKPQRRVPRSGNPLLAEARSNGLAFLIRLRVQQQGTGYCSLAPRSRSLPRRASADEPFAEKPCGKKDSESNQQVVESAKTIPISRFAARVFNALISDELHYIFGRIAHLSVPPHEDSPRYGRQRPRPSIPANTRAMPFFAVRVEKVFKTTRAR